MFKNLKVKTSLLIGFSTVLLFTIIISIVSLCGLFEAVLNLNNFIDGPFTSDTAVKTVRIETNMAASSLREMALSADKNNYDKYKAGIEENINNIKDNLEILKKSYPNNDGLVEEYENAINIWIEIGTKIIDEIDKGNIYKATAMLLEKCSPAIQSIIEKASFLEEQTEKMEDEVLIKTKNTSYIIMAIVILLFVASLLFSIIIINKVTKGIVKPLNEVELAVIEMSKGNLNTEITYESENELGILANCVRKCLSELSIYINDIDNIMKSMSEGDFNVYTTQPFLGDFENIEKSIMNFSKSMSETLEQINLSVEQVSCGSEQMAMGAQSLSQGATEQASSIEELSSTVSEISEQINKTAQNAQKTNKLVEDTELEVKSGNDKMQEMISAMSIISEKSNEISKIIKTIDDIAFQTNILALNAAVEAARAGTAGKGFSVVADEVRNLAQKSAVAAKDTTALIEGSIVAVEEGVKIADETAKSLSVVVEKTNTIRENIDKIANASTQQADAANQIAFGIEQISAVIQTNTATAEESAASSEELNGQSDLLKNLVSNFKLNL